VFVVLQYVLFKFNLELIMITIRNNNQQIQEACYPQTEREFEAELKNTEIQTVGLKQLYAFQTHPNILLFGPPGSGKGTFSGHLSQHGYKHFSLGDQVRYHIKTNSASIQPILPLIKRAYEQRVSPETLIEEPGVRDFVFNIMGEYIVQCKEDNNKPFILDGPIRSLEDVSWLLRLLKGMRSRGNPFVPVPVPVSVPDLPVRKPHR